MVDWKKEMHRARFGAIGVGLALACIAAGTTLPMLGTGTLPPASSGVRLVADVEVRLRDRLDLPDAWTPIFVRIENGSSRDLHIHFADFVLVNDTGFFRTAVNPFARARMSSPGGGTVTANQSHAFPRAFYDAPDRWPNFFHWTYPSYPRSAPAEIVRGALAEGELKAGDRTAGFLFFDKSGTATKATDLVWKAHTTNEPEVPEFRVRLEPGF